MRTSTLLIPVAAAATMIMTQQAAADFSGPYAPGNWTLTLNGGDGSANNNGTTLSLVGNNNGVDFVNTDYTIAAAAGGTLSFDWSYASGDTGTWDSGGYLVNGAYTVLAFNNSQGSGQVSIPVNAGDLIGFRVYSEDGGLGAGTLTITNFSGPIPAPGALALLGLAGLTARRRRRTA